VETTKAPSSSVEIFISGERVTLECEGIVHDEGFPWAAEEGEGGRSKAPILDKILHLFSRETRDEEGKD